MNEDNVKKLGIKAVDLVENRLGFSTSCKAFVPSRTIAKVIKVAFGTGERFVKEIGKIYKVKEMLPLF